MGLFLHATAALPKLGSKANPNPLHTYHTPEDPLNLKRPLSRSPDEIARERAVWCEKDHDTLKLPKLSPSSSLWACMRRDGDGVWQCHRCHHQNLLNLTLGAHPFGELKCRCKHVWCSDCTTSDILRPLYTDVTDPVFLAKLEKSADGRICRECGLTWKGHRYYCTCGSESWRGFIVGSSKDYREGDPDAVFGRALEQKIGVLKDTPKEKTSCVRTEEQKMEHKEMHKAPANLVLPKDFKDVLLEDETLCGHDDPYSKYRLQWTQLVGAKPDSLSK